MYHRIVVGLDGSDGAKQALRAALDLGRATGAELHLLSVEELPRYADTIDEINGEEQAARRYFKAIQKDALARASAAGVTARVELRRGHPAVLLPQFAQDVGADLLVIGHSGHSALWGKLLGTTADKIVDHAPCSVLVVR
ncbi:universal stress protein [bacterium]|nr:universal stress protein [bacterium]